MANKFTLICNKLTIHLYPEQKNSDGGFSDRSVSKESDCNAGDQGLIPGLGRFPGGGNGNPLSILAWKIP